jgi:hypothetical protein
MNINTLGLAPFSTTIASPLCPTQIDPKEERDWLLRRLVIRGPQTTTMQFAQAYIFPDMSLLEWCNMNSITFETYILYCNARPFRFIRFIKVDEEHHTGFKDGWERIIGKGVRP